jgi:hypothetical protein
MKLASCHEMVGDLHNFSLQLEMFGRLVTGFEVVSFATFPEVLQTLIQSHHLTLSISCPQPLQSSFSSSDHDGNAWP